MGRICQRAMASLPVVLRRGFARQQEELFAWASGDRLCCFWQHDERRLRSKTPAVPQSVEYISWMFVDESSRSDRPMNAQRKRTWGRKRKYRVALIGGSDVRCGAWLRICVFVYAVTLCTNTDKTKNKIRQFFLFLIKKRYQPKEMNEFNLMLNILLFTCCCIVMLWNLLN